MRIYFILFAALIVSACGRAGDCGARMADRKAVLQAKSAQVCAEKAGDPDLCGLLSYEEITAIYGSPTKDVKTAQGDRVLEFSEGGCDDYLAVLYARTTTKESGYLVASGRINDFSSFSGIAELIPSGAL